jgi:hypothetical protein
MRHGSQISRRRFLRQSVAAAGLLAVGGLGASLSVRDRVWCVRPVRSVKYARADLAHFRFKIYPSAAAARARLPHKGMRYELVRIDIGMPEGVTVDGLFNGRKDLDVRVASDVRRMQALGVDVDFVAGLVAG